MDADLNDGLTLCFARHSWACCEESAHDATSKVGELFEVRPLVSKASGYCSSHRFIKPHPLSLMWLFLSVLLLCSHFFPLLFFFFPSLHPHSPLPYYSLQVQPVVSRGSLANVPCGGSREEDSGRSHSTKKGAFHEIFNLPESERPLPGKSKYYSFLFIYFLWHPILFLYIQLRNVLKLESCVFCE